MTDTLPDFDTIRDDLAFLDEWEERYRYIIDLGGQLRGLPDEAKTEASRVRGCASQVWLLFEDQNNGKVDIRGDSDAQIVRGLIAILLSLYSGRTRGEMAAVDAESALKELDLSDHITSQRANGVASMVTRIREEATR